MGARVCVAVNSVLVVLCVFFQPEASASYFIASLLSFLLSGFLKPTKVKRNLGKGPTPQMKNVGVAGLEGVR